MRHVRARTMDPVSQRTPAATAPLAGLDKCVRNPVMTHLGVPTAPNSAPCARTGHRVTDLQVRLLIDIV